MKGAIVTLHLPRANRTRRFAAVFLLSSIGLAVQARSQANPPKSAECRVETVDYKGWHGQQLSNRWVQLIVVPQNGGRLIQVSFAGHPYLFVNPQLAGKYLPPNSGQWFNYGGDKLWLLPEGNDDEQHWVGNSDVLDDGPFSFLKLSEGQRCEIELTSPADPQTGIQFVRTIRLDADTPRIHFHASMKNVTGHTLEWSMQSVSQYDTGEPSPSVPSSPGSGSSARFNHDFWTFTPANPSSSYLNRYHVRFGPAENSAVSVRDDGLFAVHYVHMAAELWLDSTAGWLAVVDGGSRYAMVERFQYEESKPYPGKASVIFWTNGPELRLSQRRDTFCERRCGCEPLLPRSRTQQPDVPIASRGELRLRDGMVPHASWKRISRRDRRGHFDSPASGDECRQWKDQAFGFFWSVFFWTPRRALLR